MKSFNRLAYDSSEQMVYGSAKHPVVTSGGLVIGGGQVYPELNFTLPTIAINAGTMPEIRRMYADIIAQTTARAGELQAPGVVFEFETLPPMVEQPEWGIELTRILMDGIECAHKATGLRGVLRITPNDLREMHRPPLMRQGPLLEAMWKMFDGAAAAGAELLSIESVGGKEIHDEALLNCDLASVIFALTILGVRDMSFLWKELTTIAARHKVIAAGDTACGFGNTAMVLADRHYIPKTFATAVRAISAVRSLAAYEQGARGPGKDCGYENVFLKAITGCPMAMEGKTAACAHLSHVGNVAAAVCDTWSNESVQQVKLLSGMAPTCYLEQLIYDCRLMNTAAKEGRQSALVLRNWLIESDVALDPQAFILAPEQAVAVARSIVQSPTHYEAGKAAALTAIRLMREGHANGRLVLSERERPWLDTMQSTIEDLPDESRFIDQMLTAVDPAKCIVSEYGL